VLLAVLAFAAAVPLVQQPKFTDSQYEYLFDQWVAQYGKDYKQSEVQDRFDAFRANLDFVTRHNEEFSNGIQTYKVAMNEFADLTLAEFKQARLGLKFTPKPESERNVVALSGTAADSVDWRAKGAVTPVKNQGQCGSCWSFSTTGSVEGANFIKTGKLVSLSEQELVDCDNNGDQGCNGGLMDNAFTWIQKNGGLTTESNYPYKAHKSLFGCSKKKAADHAATVSGHTDVPASDEAQLALAVAKQPVSVAIEADQSGFQMYHSGVFSGDCGTALDHGVLAVGYGTDSGADYWIVKNSWGATWGEQGYIRLAKDVADSAGQCGIAMAASYPTY